jgi:hypothetical protein
MKIGVFAPANNAQARDLATAINAVLPGAACCFGLDLDGAGGAFSLSADRLIWDSKDCSALEAAYVHGFGYSDPVVPAARENVDWSVWQFEYLREQQRYSTVYSALCELPRRGVKMFNPPDAYLNCFMKAYLLEKIRLGGARVPETVCTNSLEEAESFAQDREIFWRPATGRAAWQKCLRRQRENLFALDKPPALLAGRIGAEWRRAYFFENEILLCLAHEEPVDFPAETLEQFHAIECDANMKNDLLQAAQFAGLAWGMILFRVEDGKAWIYDFDGDPVLDWLPGIFRDNLLHALACSLLGEKSRKQAPTGIEGKHARPGMFLRRMLRILFDFEQSKYR